MRLVYAFFIPAAALFSQTQAVIQTYPPMQGTVVMPSVREQIGISGAVGGVLGAAPMGVRPQMQPVSSDCALDGTVVNKITGEGIPRAQVILMGQGQQVATASDSSGRWSFVNASCGQVQFSANRPGFLGGMSGMPQAGAPFRPMILAPASAVHDVKIQLVPQAVVIGRVVDDQGDPVQGAQVSAMVSRVVAGRRSFMPGLAAQTNDLGEYRLAGLTAGRYVFCARGLNPMGIPSDSNVMGERCYPGPVDGGAASAMPLNSGSDTKVDFTLPRVAAVRISGVVTGLPKNMGVAINLVKRGTPAAGMSGSRGGAIRPDGTFTISGVTSGPYTITADFWEGGRRLMARVPLDVGTADLENVSVALEPGFAVTGTVRYESRSGAADSSPRQQFNFNLHTADGMMGGGGVQWNKDHSGFTIPELPPGNYRLDGYAQGKFYVKSAMVHGRDLSKEDVALGPAAGVIDIVLSDESGSVEGQVTGPEDAPVASWVMVLADGRQPRNLMTDATGKFKLGGLMPGEYKVYAWDDAQQVEYANPDWMRRYTGVNVSVTADQTVQAALKQASVAQ
ncbi:MAG: carboxypeptidase-like regulatory domain-containing protein [Terriglobia bacterium]